MDPLQFQVSKHKVHRRMAAIPVKRMMSDCICCRIYPFSRRTDAVPQCEKQVRREGGSSPRGMRRVQFMIYAHHELESPAWRILPLARRLRLRQLLCPVSRREAVVMGDLLARGRRSSVGSSRLGFWAAHDHGPGGGFAMPRDGRAGWCYFWGVLWGFGGLTFGLTMRYLGMSLGMAVAAGVLRGVWDLDAADLQRRVCIARCWAHFGPGDSPGRRRLPGGHRHRRHGGHVQGEREMSPEQKKSVHQRV